MCQQASPESGLVLPNLDMRPISVHGPVLRPKSAVRVFFSFQVRIAVLPAARARLVTNRRAILGSAGTGALHPSALGQARPWAPPRALQGLVRAAAGWPDCALQMAHR